MTPKPALDRLDHALLAQLQLDNQTSARVLAGRVGASESVILRRLRRLRRAKVIVADVSVVDAACLGRPLTVHVLVSLGRESASAVETFGARLSARPEVREAWYVTGEPDFLVRLQLVDMNEYEAFAREVFLSDFNVQSFRTLVGMRRVTAAHTRALAPATGLDHDD